jgi:putative ABC transport system permease protein
VFNTLLASVMERTTELSLMRAIGASRSQIFALVGAESVLLTGLGTLGGLVLAMTAGPFIENLAKGFVPLAPSGSLLSITPAITIQCSLIALTMGIVAGVYPAWQAARTQPADAAKME